ncbi:unnamed protein product [Lampetra fluviatilis]
MPLQMALKHDPGATHPAPAGTRNAWDWWLGWFRYSVLVSALSMHFQLLGALFFKVFDSVSQKERHRHVHLEAT